MAEDVQDRSDPARQVYSPGKRRLIAATAVGAAALAIGVPAALADRDRPDPPPAAAAPEPSATPFDEQRPPSLPPWQEHQPEPPPASPNPLAVKGMPNPDGCPVNAPRLLDALRGSALYRELAAPRALADVDCYATYALARTEPDAAGRATIIFRYTEMTDSWRPVSGGRSAACEGIPKAVRPHLEHCG